jgi:hypothetical protein
VPCSNFGGVDLALQLVSDDRLTAGDRLDPHLQSLLGKQALVLRDVQASQVSSWQGWRPVISASSGPGGAEDFRKMSPLGGRHLRNGPEARNSQG